ncbi:MAG TPA: hypothetical protein VK961_05925 [Chthoniobacter sp.]|nr:hypothetical protein [Chthoniobacter sp.]
MSVLCHTLAAFLLVVCTANWSSAADAPILKCPSPDKRLALKLTPPKGGDSFEYRAELVEQASGEFLLDLGTAYPKHLQETVLVWSAKSNWVAYATRGDKEGDVNVYFWNGAVFEEVQLPSDLPRPVLQYRHGAGANVKNYGGAVTPLRWLRSGDLELSSDVMMLSRVDNHAYTGVVKFTLHFDKQHHATVNSVGKTKMQVDD